MMSFDALLLNTVMLATVALYVFGGERPMVSLPLVLAGVIMHLYGVVAKSLVRRVTSPSQKKAEMLEDAQCAAVYRAKAMIARVFSQQNTCMRCASRLLKLITDTIKKPIVPLLGLFIIATIVMVMIGRWLSNLVQGCSPYVRLPLAFAVGGLLSNFHWLASKGFILKVILSFNEETYARANTRILEFFGSLMSAGLQGLAHVVAYLSTKIDSPLGMFAVLMVGQWMHHPQGFRLLVHNPYLRIPLALAIGCLLSMAVRPAPPDDPEGENRTDAWTRFREEQLEGRWVDLVDKEAEEELALAKTDPYNEAFWSELGSDDISSEDPVSLDTTTLLNDVYSALETRHACLAYLLI